MIKKLFLLLLPVLVSAACSINKPLSANQQEDDKAAILAVLKMQEEAWSKHDIDTYMQGYWKSDSLKFYGSSGLTFGWQKTLDNYKRAYPTAEDTGTLSFTIESMTPIEKNAYYVMGRYHLERKKGNADGVFMIIFKKINGHWRVIADLSC